MKTHPVSPKSSAIALLALGLAFYAPLALNAAHHGSARHTRRQQQTPQISTLRIQADKMAADNVTGTVVASGHVHAVAHPVSLFSDLVAKKGDVYEFTNPTTLTTCTNHMHDLHWSISGEVVYRDKKSVTVKDVVVRAWDVPVLWLPWWYYPLDTDYGLRIMPGYSSRWGAYLLTKYVYGIAGSFDEGAFGLSGSTRLDLRTKNGVALGQGLKWQLGGFGRGKFKAYYAWDLDADRYDHHWRSERKWHYENWGSKVPDERYALMLDHLWEATERDIVRVKGSYFSDSHFRNDFLRDGLFHTRNHFIGHDGNELAWEHNETSLAFGASVSGPLNRFYGGVARLPEAYLDVMPVRVFSTPFVYENDNSLGFYNRNYAKYGDRTTREEFRYNPGRWADYQTFRADSYHRLTLPFKVADVLSVVPRVAVRGTYWDDTGYETRDGRSRAGSTGDSVFRTIVEGGATFSARAKGWIAEDWQHLFEPYLDVLAQEARYSGLRKGARPYVFDSVDASRGWLDQFAGRSRNLPYSYYGVTPGIRNALREADEDGRLRTVLDFDVYAAIQFNKTEFTEGSRHHRLASRPSRPNYGKDRGEVYPGARLRWFPDEYCSLSARAEYDTENDALAYAEFAWDHALTDSFSYQVALEHRDHRMWDYSSSPYDREVLKGEDFNMARFSHLEFSFEQDVCDALAWGPYIRWDCRERELDEIGAWVDLRTDCLGFRFSVGYENDYERVDYSKTDDDWRFGFFVYLRALGPDSGSAF